MQLPILTFEGIPMSQQGNESWRLGLRSIAALLMLTLSQTWIAPAARGQESTPRVNSAWIQPGDRVAWLGGRLWEELAERGDLESILSIRMAGQPIAFRNVGWSGDDVEGRARAVFGSVEDGYKRRLVDLKQADPTVVFVHYGLSEAMDDGWNDQRFDKGLRRLVTDLKPLSYRLVLLQSPAVPSGTRFPEARRDHCNQKIERFNQIIQQIADQEGLKVLQLPAWTQEMSDDGIQLHASGYQEFADRFASIVVPGKSQELPGELRVDLKGNGKLSLGEWSLEVVDRDNANGKWRLEEAFAALPERSLDQATADGRSIRKNRLLVVTGLPPGRYQWTLEGEVVATGSAEEWAKGLEVSGVGADRQRLALQKTAKEKDTLFMHQYRPQNETYLFLFRKHEQGNNAGEVQAFEKLTKQWDATIQELAKPKRYTWEWTRIGD